MKFRKYSIQFKNECIKYIEIIGINNTSKQLGISRKCIRNWYLNKEKLKHLKEYNTIYRLPGGGAKVKYPKEEKHIVNFILKCLDIGIVITYNLIIKELIRIQPEMKKKNINALKKWCYRLLKRNNFSITKFK